MKQGFIILSITDFKKTKFCIRAQFECDNYTLKQNLPQYPGHKFLWQWLEGHREVHWLHHKAEHYQTAAAGPMLDKESHWVPKTNADNNNNKKSQTWKSILCSRRVKSEINP